MREEKDENLLYDAAFKVVDGHQGLSRTDICDLYDRIAVDDVYPVEIRTSEYTAMGFVSRWAGKKLEYDYLDESNFANVVGYLVGQYKNDNKEKIHTYMYRAYAVELRVWLE